MSENTDFLRRAARELSASDGFRAVVKALKERALFEWANTPSGAAERREELYRDIQAVGRLEGILQGIVQGDRIEQRKVEKAAKRGPNN